MAWAGTNTVAADAFLAICLSLIALTLGTSTADSPGLVFDTGRNAFYCWSVALALPMVFRRARPKPAALAYVAVAALQLLLGPSLTYGDLFSLIMLYSVLAYGNSRDTRSMIATGFGMGFAASAVNTIAVNAGSWIATVRSGSNVGMPQHSAECATFWTGEPGNGCIRTLAVDFAGMATMVTVLLISVIILAFWHRARIATVRAMQERNAALEASQAEEQRIAASAERARIARDMHDVVAHTLSTIIIQSDGGRYAGANNPAVARSTMVTIQRESERALHDMTRLLGVFGGPRHAEYADIAQLLDAATATLATVHGTLTRTLSGSSKPERLSHEAGEAIYRLVQESLTNIRKYAGPNVHVTIREQWGDQGVSIAVADDGQGSSADSDDHDHGYGLIGMRERIEAVGGTVEAGPRATGGFEVRAWIPYAASRTEGAETAPQAAAPAGPTDRVAAIPESFVTQITERLRSALGNGKLRHANETAAANDENAETASATRPNNQGGHSTHGNIVERMSHWTERHYWLMDVVTATLIALVTIHSGFLYAGVWGPYAATGDETMVAVEVTVAICCAMAIRRRFPMASAVMTATFCACQLVFFEPLSLINLLVLPIIYSAVAYGRTDAWKSVTVIACVDSLLCGVKLTAYHFDSPTVAAFLASIANHSIGSGNHGPYSIAASVVYGALFGFAVMLMCMATIVLALWTRSRGANALILQQREDALREQQRKASTMAANAERERISTAMQAEIAATLTGVADQAAAGLAMLDTNEANGTQPSPESIVAAFKAIGDQGREALAHMRQLLRVLRQTESSDEQHADEAAALQLAPARSLNEQLRNHSDIGDNRIQ